MAFIPIIVPHHISTPKCPNCKCNENKKEVCGNCGHEYVRIRNTVEDIVIVALLFFILIPVTAVLLTFGNEVHERVKVNNISWSLAFHKEALDWGFIKEKEK